MIHRFLSWNTNGINQPTKRRKVLNFIRKHKVDIAFLQESHLTDAEHCKLGKQWQGQIYYSSFTSQARGVVILLRKGIPFQLEHLERDKGGRYVLVRGFLANKSVTMLNVYGPNQDDADFFVNLFFKINCSPTELIIGGDFNLVLDPNMDRSSSSSKPLSSAAKALKRELTDLNMIDVWRAKHGHRREYSYYSHVHNSYSRIDMVFIHAGMEHLVTSCEYLAKTHSDHAPLLLGLNNQDQKNSPKRWRFPTHLVNDKNFVKLINEQIDFFLTVNKGSASPSIVWESMMAYIRGSTISYSSWKKKQYRAQILSLENEIKTLENEHSHSKTQATLDKLTAKRAEYDVLTTREVENAMARLKQRYYEQGDKSGKLLAWQIRREEAARYISAIKLPGGDDVVRNPLHINQAFVEFYKNLYTSQGENNRAMHSFLDLLDIPRVPEGAQINLEGKISKQELLDALTRLPGGKAPGPDGFTIDFFKTFTEKLIDPLLEMFNYAIENNQLPQTLQRALIIVLLKPGKDPRLCGSYRPISLLSTEYKLLTKVIATRLEKIVPHLVNLDQTGFIQNRSSIDNVRRFLNIVHCAKSINDPVLAVSLDAEKAFDRVEWHFLFAVLHKMNLGPNMLNMIKLLYLNPTAMIQTNSDVSPPFSLSRGTRQGCPLSPLLFALAVEPLAIAIRTHPSISGVMIADANHVVSLYADDIVLFLTNLSTTLPALTDLLDIYSGISGYKVNMQKSVALPLNLPAEQIPQENFPFQWNTQSVTYLGLEIATQLDKTFSLNYDTLLKKAEKDLDRWMQLPISLIGRVNCIKMNLLPRFLYLFQTLPISIPSNFFKKLEGAISRFIWRGKVPRIKIKTLYNTPHYGGLKLPNFEFFYWAAQLRAIWFWQTEMPNPPAWRQIEQFHAADVPLAGIPFIKSYHALKDGTSNPFIIHTSKLWSTIQLRTRSVKLLHSNTPFHTNPALPPVLRDGLTKRWHSMGIKTFGDLYDDNILKSFEQLKDSFNIPAMHFFKYLQVRHFICSQQGGHPTPLESPVTDNILKGIQCPKGMVSVIYSRILDLLTNKTLKSRSKWEQDLDFTFKDCDWEALCSSAQRFSYNSRHRLLQFNLIHRIYFTPERLHKMYGTISELCPRCKAATGSLIHMFWDCVNLKQFWDHILDALKGITGIEIPHSPRLILLGDLSVLPANKIRKTRFIRLSLIAGSKCIAILWKSENPPTVSMWLKEVASYMASEKIMFNVKKKPHLFEKCWSDFKTYLDKFSVN